MASVEKEAPVRLEDIVCWAREGKEVKTDVELTKEDIIQKIFTETLDAEERGAYLLTGNFIFDVDGKIYKISKIYLRGYASESSNLSAANRNIANARLDMDYERLGQGGIRLEKKYFEKVRL